MRIAVTGSEMMTHQRRQQHDDWTVERSDDEDDTLGLRANLGAHRPEAQVELSFVGCRPRLHIIVCHTDILVCRGQVDANSMLVTGGSRR